MIVGIDEAGKGCVIGPLVVCGVRCDDRISELPVRDSKKLDRKKREEIARKLAKTFEHEIVVVSAEELNDLMERKSLNEILLEAYAKIIDSLEAEVYYVDSPDVKPDRLSERLEALTGKKVVAMHNAEEIPCVAAASILAKVTRDRMIEELKKTYGDFGSGYPADEKTRKFLKDHLTKGELPPIVRRKWKTLEKISQMSLLDFG